MSLLDKLGKFEKSDTQENKKQIKIQDKKEIKKIAPEPKKKIDSLIKSTKKELFNKSIELNSIKTIYANRFGSSTDKLKKDMQNAIINAWKK